jgi:hypothetical protein
MLGNLRDSVGGSTTRPYTVQWSAIDDPQYWPTPGSDEAIASQSGNQMLNPTLGEVMGIFGNDQFGVIFQQGGVTRVTYVGGTTVFQFDEYEVGRGLLFPNSATTALKSGILAPTRLITISARKSRSCTSVKYGRR